MAANNCMQCDVAIVGSGFAGALIANELSAKGIKVIILEAGPGVQPNINDFMKRFYTASAKVPERLTRTSRGFSASIFPRTMPTRCPGFRLRCSISASATRLRS
jgi:choline dehydrogenase-like flavoprotein